MTYPTTPRGAVVDDYHGTPVPDPYRWMEDLDAAATADWVAAQNAVTESYLATLPLRQHFLDRLTALWNYPRVSLPVIEGGRLFYAKNTGLQRQAPIFMRAAPTAAPRLVLDPNTISEDGSTSLAQHAPSPDATLFAYALSKGGADWQTIKVRDIADRRGPRGRSPLDALLESLVDEGRKGLLLLALSRATEAQGARSRALRAGALLPPRRHAASGRRPRLRAQGSGRLADQRNGDRRRPIPADHDGRRLGQPEPPVLRRPRRLEGARYLGARCNR